MAGETIGWGSLLGDRDKPPFLFGLGEVISWRLPSKNPTGKHMALSTCPVFQHQAGLGPLLCACAHHSRDISEQQLSALSLHVAQVPALVSQVPSGWVLT